jgi:hypothetical protein
VTSDVWDLVAYALGIAKFRAKEDAERAEAKAVAKKQPRVKAPAQAKKAATRKRPVTRRR